MSGMGQGIQHFGRQSLDVFMADAKYVSDVWNGNVSQSSLSEIGTRNARLILVGIRTLVGLAAVQLTCQTLKAITRLPRMTAFSFIDTTLVILFKVVVLHDIFKITSNLTSKADLSDGILSSILTERVYHSYGNGIAASRVALEGTCVPFVWDLALQHVHDSMESRNYGDFH